MEQFFSSHLVLSITTLALAFVSKFILIRLIKNKSSSEGIDKRLYINSVKNLINIIVIIAIFYIWHEELKDFALSVAAFVVAIVLATRELIQCVIGFIYLSSSTTFRIGDWIQVGNNTGEVTSTDWAKIALLEVDPIAYGYTGKTVFIPNSQLMAQPIKNLNFMRRYINHSFSITKNDRNINPFSIKQALFEKANAYCQEFSDVAERYNQLIENRLDISLSGPEPSIEFSTTDIGKTRITISLFCPTEQAKSIEQKLTDDFYNLWLELVEPLKIKEDNDE